MPEVATTFNEHELGIRLAIVIVNERIRQCESDLEGENLWMLSTQELLKLKGSLTELQNLLVYFNKTLET
tara:strand:+ start:360 stop:569 length:210 start_codon:yes stop_codon:yes gene_type:complete